MKKSLQQNIKEEMVIYQSKSGALKLKGDFTNDTIWATQAQIAEVFGVTPQNITIHLRNLYKDNELDNKSTCKDSLQVQSEGQRQVTRSVKIYNLDVMIAVGYRINSVIGTQFLQWATKTLKQHIVEGYTINPERVTHNYNAFIKAVNQVMSRPLSYFTPNFSARLVNLLAFGMV
jgi:hypothetical protein